MNLSTILTDIFTRDHDDMIIDFDLPATKPAEFFVTEYVIHETTGQCAQILKIVPYPYMIDGTFDHGVYCAYVRGYSDEMQSHWTDHWLYDDMALWIDANVVAGWAS